MNRLTMAVGAMAADHARYGGTFGFAGVTGVDTVYASRTRWEAGDGPHALAIAGQVLLFL
jgi:hypothetical protein